MYVLSKPKNPKTVSAVSYPSLPNNGNTMLESISIGMNFRSKYALSVNLNNEYTREMELGKENNVLKVEINSIREEMNKQFTKIMSMIQQNPLLACIKPEALKEKTKEV